MADGHNKLFEISLIHTKSHNYQKTILFVVKCPFKTIYNSVATTFSLIKGSGFVIYQIYYYNILYFNYLWHRIRVKGVVAVSRPAIS